MKIAKRLQINNWISLGIAIISLLSFAFAFIELQKAQIDQALVEEMRKIAFDRTNLRDEYFLYNEERAYIQWIGKTAKLRSLIESAQKRLTGSREKVLLADIHRDFEATVTIIPAFYHKQKTTKNAAAKGYSSAASQQRLIGQVLLKAYALNDSITRLFDLKVAEEAKKYNILLFTILFVIFGGILLMLINSIAINRIIAKRLITLQEGIKTIGAGNLAYHINDEGNDELADLARAGNEMAASLRLSHTSIDQLQKEIDEHELTKRETTNIYRHQQALLSAIPDIIMEVDVNKIYTWANEPGIAFFGTDVIGKPADYYFAGRQETYDNVRPLFEGSEDIIYIESWQRRRDGEERLLAWWCRVLKDVQGNVTGALSSARDITERRRATEEIQRLNAELEQRVLLRTTELASKNDELERINKIFVDRELRMRELKARIAELEKKS